MTGDQAALCARRDTPPRTIGPVVPPGCRGLDILTASLGATYCAPNLPPPLVRPPPIALSPLFARRQLTPRAPTDSAPPHPLSLPRSLFVDRCRTRADAREFGRRAVDARRCAGRIDARAVPAAATTRLILIDHSGPPRPRTEIGIDYVIGGRLETGTRENCVGGCVARRFREAAFRQRDAREIARIREMKFRIITMKRRV